MKSDKVLITGCGGMLGSAIYPYFISRYANVMATDKEVNEKWLMQLDVRDEAHLSRVFKEYRPNLVLHLAAETDLEYCETHPDITNETNALATRSIAKLSEEFRSTLVYISTAGVFDGLKEGFYTEIDQPNPIMLYGKTKYEGELHVMKNCSKKFIVRAGWMMGGGRKKEKKFISKILRQIAERKKEIFAVEDLWGTPTYAYDFSINLFDLIKTEKFGVYHMACEGKGTRFDVAKEILRACRRPKIKLTAVTSDFFAEEYFVVRPRSEMMKNVNLSKIGLNLMRSWKETLKEYIYDYYFDYIDHFSSNRIERRKHCRRNCYYPVKFSLQDELSKDFIYPGICIDTSVFGKAIITDIDLQPGQIITFRITDTPYAFRNTSIVRYTTKENGRYRIGLEITH